MRSIWPRGPVPGATASGSPTSAGRSPSAARASGLLLPQCGTRPWTSSTGSGSPAATPVIAARILKEIRARLGFLKSVGLPYLTLSRAAATLSGGEAQRNPAGDPDRLQPDGRPLYPGRALHRPAPAGQRQAHRHPQAAAGLGNTLLVVEHDEDTMRAADYIVDVGPARASTAARSWPPGLWRTSWPSPGA